MNDLAAALLRDAIISGMRIATETPIEQVPAAIADVLAALLRDVERWRPEHPGVMVPDPNGVWVDHRHVLAALSRALDPARGVGVPADVKDYAIDVSEAYDTVMEVQRNPAGAWQVIQALAGHIARAALTTEERK